MVRTAVLAVLAACAHGSPRAQPDPVDAPAPLAEELPADAVRRYTIWLGGAQVGTAEERERWSADGVVLTRQERLAFLRGEAAVALTTTIEITADPGLVPRHVRWTETGATTRTAEAVRDARGWTITEPGPAGLATPRLPAEAIPAELIPLVIRTTRSFDGTVFLPARGFVAGRARVEPVAPARLVARLTLDAGVTAASTIDLDDDGAPARIVDGEGVIAIRATAAEARAPFTPVDLVAATSVPLRGAPERARARRLVLAGDLAIPPLPGQAARPTSGGLELELSPALAGDLPPGPHGPDRTPEIEALVAGVQRRVVPDLAAGTSAPRQALAATAGDCTTFALAYAALAERLAIPTRVVTGLRVDGARLVRHRWAVSWTGARWIAVDAAFGAVPAGGDLVGLAVHDADDAGLIAGEAALTRIRDASWR